MACQTDEEFQNNILKDEIFDALLDIGFMGVPSKQTLLRRPELIR